MIILNSAEAVQDLMEKRSTIYSDRYAPYFAGDILGWKEVTGMLPHNDQHREARKILSRAVGAVAAKRYWPLLHHEAAKFVARLVADPDNLFDITRM